mmetsp:Transcript_61113/g.126189  ORF Transcript_61113/g.126189 Transcript_61113/m.126189 type:complete len:97 (-) Transcript_61113:91-381(-)
MIAPLSHQVGHPKSSCCFGVHNDNPYKHRKVARGAARRAMLWGVKRGRAKIRVAAPVRNDQDFCEHLPLSGADRMSLSFVCEEGPGNEDGTPWEHV